MTSKAKAAETPAFDFDAFIEGTSLPRDTVRVARVDRSQQIADLTTEHDRHVLAGEDDEARQFARKIKALRDEMVASEVAFELRALTPDEYKQLADDDSLDIYDQMEIQSTSLDEWTSPNELTADQWRKIGERIGAGQWMALTAKANELAVARVAVPDFSRSVSMTLATRASFKN